MNHSRVCVMCTELKHYLYIRYHIKEEQEHLNAIITIVLLFNARLPNFSVLIKYFFVFYAIFYLLLKSLLKAIILISVYIDCYEFYSAFKKIISRLFTVQATELSYKLRNRFVCQI